MARGWESKGVEEQMDAHERRPKSTQPPRNPELDSVELQRTRVSRDLEGATNPNYRALLERTLRFLDERIAALK